ncbi:MAG TPA: hypothetical protein VF297_04400 [Pyrinomonadaceae bacterium]
MKAGVMLLCVSAVVYAVEICRRTHVLSKEPTDRITLHETRLAELRKRLPARGVVGYVSDDFGGAETPQSWRRFATTQYSLAPLILERTTTHELVVGVFDDPASARAVAAGGDLLPVEEFGEGVVLFKKK